ncbi:Uncharacterised protein [Amycolatopsis camponoti]|uniref:Uncharacterized protein n=1 Tax=Amycolatopsis camponoti TaxID=2606593 RepID=A0A6I8LXR6_9PSEU|nr:Uncharacterised protein [Amycolatopsis camponoti]
MGAEPVFDAVSVGAVWFALVRRAKGEHYDGHGGHRASHRFGPLDGARYRGDPE